MPAHVSTGLLVRRYLHEVCLNACCLYNVYTRSLYLYTETATRSSLYRLCPVMPVTTMMAAVVALIAAAVTVATLMAMAVQILMATVRMRMTSGRRRRTTTKMATMTM